LREAGVPGAVRWVVLQTLLLHPGPHRAVRGVDVEAAAEQLTQRDAGLAEPGVEREVYVSRL
jgi:hypothetical protein